MKKLIRNSTTEFLIFTPQTSGYSIDIQSESETAWLSPKLIAELLKQRQKDTHK